MQKIYCRPQFCMALRILAISSFTSLIFFLSSYTVAAHISLTAQDGPTFSLNAGFDSRYREGSWVPLQITLSNDGPDFSGKVSVNVPAPYSGQASNSSLYTYQGAVSLPTGAKKQITLYVPFSFGTTGDQAINVDLLNSTNQKIGTQSTVLRSLDASDIFIGMLSDQSSGFGPLSQIQLPDPNASIRIESLRANANTSGTAPLFPDKAEVLNNFSAIILDNFTTSTLSPEQILALQSWVGQGGTLIAVGGPEWKRTLSPLPANLVPVTATDIGSLPSGTHLLPIGGPTKGGPDQSPISDMLTVPVKISTATTQPGSTTLLASGNTPLIVQSQQGQGQVYYLAFDPLLDPLVGWSNTANLWKGLLLRGLGDKMLAPDIKTTPPPGWTQSSLLNSNMDGLLQSLFPNSFPSVWLILLLLIGYVVVLGPIRLILVRIFKRRDWSWRIALSTIVVFSLLSYGLALQQKGTSIISSSISIIRLSRPDNTTSMAHISTSVGVFVPSEGDFQIHIPGKSLVTPITNQFNYYRPATQQQPATLLVGADGTDVNLPGVEIWTVRSLVSTYDRQLQGGITSNLTLQGNNLVGTVTNSLPYALNDAYVLIGNTYQALGRLQAGEVRDISLSLASPSGGDQTIAGQIANANHITPAGPYDGSPQPQNDLQRHISMLETLSGEDDGYNCSANGYCYQPVKSNNYNGSSSQLILSGGPSFRPLDRDPLLLDDAPATLVGWADNHASLNDQVTINGAASSGTQEAMVTAPLDVNFSGQVTLLSNMVPGQLVDVQNQGNTLQKEFQGVYTMTTGSMTFEYTVPGNPKWQNSSIALSEPSNLVSPYGASGGTQSSSDVNRLRTYLYNWQTNSWNAQAFNNFALTIPDAQPYINAQGRILIQFANQDTLLGTTRLSKPELQLSGMVSR